MKLKENVCLHAQYMFEQVCLSSGDLCCKSLEIESLHARRSSMRHT